MHSERWPLKDLSADKAAVRQRLSKLIVYAIALRSCNKRRFAKVVLTRGPLQG